MSFFLIVTRHEKTQVLFLFDVIHDIIKAQLEQTVPNCSTLKCQGLHTSQVLQWIVIRETTELC